jgi:hypothetical protein
VELIGKHRLLPRPLPLDRTIALDASSNVATRIESLGSAHSERLKPTHFQQLLGKSSSIMSPNPSSRKCDIAMQHANHELKRMPHNASPIEQRCNTSRLFATV